MAECVIEYHIRSDTNERWCATHQMWLDKSEFSSEPNPEHEALLQEGKP